MIHLLVSLQFGARLWRLRMRLQQVAWHTRIGLSRRNIEDLHRTPSYRMGLEQSTTRVPRHMMHNHPSGEMRETSTPYLPPSGNTLVSGVLRAYWLWGLPSLDEGMCRESQRGASVPIDLGTPGRNSCAIAVIALPLISHSLGSTTTIPFCIV